MLEQLNVFSDSDVDAATEALNDVSCPLVNRLPKEQKSLHVNILLFIEKTIYTLFPVVHLILCCRTRRCW